MQVTEDGEGGRRQMEGGKREEERKMMEVSGGR